jgi:hypothetical protein
MTGGEAGAGAAAAVGEEGVGGELGWIATGGGGELGGVAMGGRGSAVVCCAPSGCALGNGASVLRPLLMTTMAITMAPVTTPIAATMGQRRPPRGKRVLAPAEPEMVDGSTRGAVPGSSAARGGSVPARPRVRCTEIAAWVADCAYFASACASSAMF